MSPKARQTEQFRRSANVAMMLRWGFLEEGAIGNSLDKFGSSEGLIPYLEAL